MQKEQLLKVMLVHYEHKSSLMEAQNAQVLSNGTASL